MMYWNCTENYVLMTGKFLFSGPQRLFYVCVDSIYMCLCVGVVGLR